jgi:CheY-like chemotaxis protein
MSHRTWPDVGLASVSFVIRVEELFHSSAVAGRYVQQLAMTKTLVLVVEDEPIIRMNAVAMIEDAGYDVIKASNADDAIVLLETRPDIRVVFSDIEMPGSMDGLKMLHVIRERRPPVILILASGRVSPPVEDMPSVEAVA